MELKYETKNYRKFNIKITHEDPIYWDEYDEFRITYHIEVICSSVNKKIPFNKGVGKIKSCTEINKLTMKVLEYVQMILDQDNFFEVDSISVPSDILDLTK